MARRRVEVNIHGLKEIEAQLARAPRNLRDKILTKAIKDAVKRIAEMVRAAAPRPAEPDPTLSDIHREVRHRVRDQDTKIIGTALITRRASQVIPLEYGHSLIAWGHPTGGVVYGDPFFRRTTDSSETFTKGLIVGRVRRQVADLVK